MALFGVRVIVLLLVGQQCASAVLCPSLSEELEVIEYSEQHESSDELGDPNIGSITVQDEMRESTSDPPWATPEAGTVINEGISISLQHQTYGNLSGWPAPSNITLVKLGIPSTAIRARFEMRWSIRSAADLQGFRVKLCTPKCVETSVNRTQFRVLLDVPFYTKFTTAVIAIFQPANSTRLIEISSNVYEYKSGVGPPSAIKRLKGKLDESTKSLKLWWDRPSPSNGPIHHYILQVSDSLDSTKKRVLTPTTIEATMDVSEMSGYGYEIIIQAVNIDANTTQEMASSEYKLSLTHRKLIRPAAAVPIWRSTDSIRFEISPPNYRDLPPFPLFYKINTSAHLESDYVTQLAVIDRLAPFENVTIEVSTCYQTALFKQYVCGEALRARGTTNVAAPSLISKVDLIRSSSNDTVLKWALPDKPNGPISGFRVYITEIVDSNTEKITTRDLDRSARSVTFLGAELATGKSYEFAVAAFNKDLETQEYYYGEETKATLLIPPAGQAHWVVPVVVFAVLLMLCVVGAGVFYYSRSRGSLPSFLNISK